MRFLAVFSRLGWQVIDTYEECQVVNTGSLEEMRLEAEELNDIADGTIAYG